MINQYFLGSHFIRRVWIFWLSVLICTTSFAQTNRFTLVGRVTDANGAGIPGVTVQGQGTMTGTASDADGNYSFDTNLAPGSYTLNFSAVGYALRKETIQLASAETVTTNATLKEDIANLDEVVVTASTLSGPKRQLGNAISTIKAQDLQQSGSGGLLNSLQGKVPGAQIVQNSGDPAGSLSIRLRGLNRCRVRRTRCT